MKNKKTHIAVTSIIMILILALLLPSAVKFTHVFEDHKHEVCTDNSNTHFHEVETDCEFYKFNVNNPFVLFINDLQINHFKNGQNQIINHYFLIDSFKIFDISQRGPPLHLFLT